MRILAALGLLVCLSLAQSPADYTSCDCPAGTVFSMAPNALCDDGVSSSGPMGSCWYLSGKCVERWSQCEEDCTAVDYKCSGTPAMYFTCTQCTTSKDCVPYDYCGYDAEHHTCRYLTMDTCPVVACSINSCGPMPSVAARVCCDQSLRAPIVTCEADDAGGCSWFFAEPEPCPEDIPCESSDCPTSSTPEPIRCPDGSTVQRTNVCDRETNLCECLNRAVPVADCPTSIECSGVDACANAPIPSFAALLCWDGSVVAPSLGDCVPSADGSVCGYEILPAPECPPLPVCEPADCADLPMPAAFAALSSDCVHTAFWSEPKCVSSLDGLSCQWQDACATEPCCRDPIPGGCDCADQAHVETSTPGCEWTCVLNALKNTCAWAEVCDVCVCDPTVAIQCSTGDSTVAGASSQCIHYADGSCGLALQPCPDSCCGPAPGLAARLCADGSVGGFTGKCLESCQWEIRDCPEPAPTGPSPSGSDEQCKQKESVRGTDGICRLISRYIVTVTADANQQCPAAATLSAAISAEISARCSECLVSVSGLNSCEYAVDVLHPEDRDTNSDASAAADAVVATQDPSGNSDSLLTITPANGGGVVVFSCAGLLALIVAALL